MGISALRERVDSLVVIPNERLKMVSDTPITMFNAFDIADDVLRQGVSSISDLINIPGYVNLDFADIGSVMRDAGYAHMGVGSATGRDMVEEAASKAISSPLIETTINGAKGVIVSILSSPDVSLEDVEAASGMIAKNAHSDANIIWGIAFDNDMKDEVKITVIATGFDSIASETVNLGSFGLSGKGETKEERPAMSSTYGGTSTIPFQGTVVTPPTTKSTNPSSGSIDDIDVVLDLFKKK